MIQSKSSLYMNRTHTGKKLPPGAVAPPPEMTEEEMFSTVFNETVFKKFLRFLAPYKLMISASFLAVIVFTLTQLAFPILIQKTLDRQFTFLGDGLESLKAGLLIFAAVVVLNFISHFCMEFLISRVA